ncbi:hypothetical protein Bbelb_132790 [Branchiostoma belcheri]|nr:hypothetical protein Bbelb_132790 [Branchiostoma belcheri]
MASLECESTATGADIVYQKPLTHYRRYTLNSIVDLNEPQELLNIPLTQAYERATYGLRESNFTILTCNCCTDSARSTYVPRTVLASSVLTPHFPVDLLNDHAEHTCTISVYKDNLTGDCQLVSKMPRKAQKKTTRQDPKKRAAEDTRAASDDEVIRRCTHLQRATIAQRSFVVSTYNSPLAQRTMHATADGQACRADHVRTPCATVRVTYSLGRPPYVCRKNVADVATTKTYGQKARTASCDRRFKGTLWQSSASMTGLFNSVIDLPLASFQQRGANCLTVLAGPQDVPHSPAERTTLSHRTYRTLPQNVPHSPTERTALSRRTYRTLPQNVPHSPAERTALSHRTYRTLPQNVPHSPTERTTLSHRTYHTLPQNVPHSPAELTALSHRTYRTLPQNVPHSPTERTTLSHRTYHTLPQNVPHSPTERTALSRRTYHTLPQNVPHSPTERTTLSRRTYHTLPQNVPHSPTERTALSRRTYRTLPQNVPHSPAERTALSHRTYRTLPQNVPHSPTERTTLSHRTYHTLPQNVPHSPTERTALSHRTYHTLPQNVPHSPTERTALSRRTYRTLPQNVPHSPTERTALSHRTYRTLPQNVPHSPAGRTALSRRTYHTLPQNVPHSPTELTALSHRTYRTLPQNVPHSPTERTALSHRTYRTLPQDVPHSPAERTTLSHRTYRTLPQSVPHSPTERPSKIEAYFVACGLKVQLALVLIAAIVWQSEAYWRLWRQPVWPREYCDFPPTGEGIVRKNCSWPYRNGDTCKFECRKRYKRRSGDTSRYCRQGIWSGQPLVCLFVGCRLPQFTRGVRFNGCYWPHKNVESCTYICRKGYSRVYGDSTITCRNGTWSGMPLTCKYTGCRRPPYTRHGLSRDCQWPYENGKNCTYTCRDGYSAVSGSTTITCVNGHWSGNPLQCRRTCTRGAWGPYTCRSPYEEGETCTYRCLRGFRRLHGETSRTCTGGRWTGGELFCIYTGVERPWAETSTTSLEPAVSPHHVVSFLVF